jgi:serine/threonine protein kinase
MQSLEEPEYTVQVQELVERGFNDRTAILNALIAKQGNVDAAAAKLLRELPNFIGEGRSGKVFFPALLCKDNRNIPSNYASKLVSEKDASKELEQAEKVKQYLPNDALYVLDTCESSVKDKMYGLWRDTLVFSKYGGQDINFLLDLHDLYYRPTLLQERGFTLEKLSAYKKVLASLRYLREKINEMNEKGFFHNDIQYDNIIYNEEEDKSYLVDFESAAHTPLRGLADVKPMDAIISEVNQSIEGIERHLVVGRGIKKSKKRKTKNKTRKSKKKTKKRR